jgi:hypothetical protein
LDTSFQEHYASISDDELLNIAGDRRDLREEAVLALVGGVLIVLGGELVLMLLITPHEPLYVWLGPILVVYFGTSLACLAVQTWVRRTVSFWISLAIACLPQFEVNHWLTVYHPAHLKGDTKGAWFLSILSGYVVGCAVFLLLQKLKPAQGSKAAD